MSSIVIPQTTRNRYLSGIAALNLPSAAGTGDWHFLQTFFVQRSRRSTGFICGLGCEIDTTAFLGDVGVFECSKLLKSLDIEFVGDAAYSANHTRAVADLVIAAIRIGRNVDHLCIDDWLPKMSDKERLIAMLQQAYSNMNEELRQALNVWVLSNLPK
ncbi:hypothetical protein MT1_0358 [Pseudomonas sp. MT-1]|jgi:hypothetical protein|uniref:Uncharacterized protein n=1 Tax=Stutzerimonas stutzeri TaxID=316 RepID=A0A172WNB7_STUST|nr:hypothetical protein PS273GM_06890 [Stutzerimonas stutzeri]AZZ47385.1 hypothetical protein C1896_22055 [Pseudomonadaceae bacterium SI-3]BAP77534.1 hypothetical protein MT1_0358 [Pseudomonas sp. MT-1]